MTLYIQVKLNLNLITLKWKEATFHEDHKLYMTGTFSLNNNNQIPEHVLNWFCSALSSHMWPHSSFCSLNVVSLHLQHIWLHMKLNQSSFRVWLLQTDCEPWRGRPLRTCCCGWRPAASLSDMQAADCTNWRSANCSRHSTRGHDKNDSISHSFIKTKN